MQDAITWDIINNVWPVVLAVITIVVWLNRQFSKAGESRVQLEQKLTDHVSKKVEGIENKIAGLNDKVNEVERELLRHQRYAAEKFATKEELLKSSGDVKESIDRLSDRVNQLIEAKQPVRRTSSKP